MFNFIYNLLFFICSIIILAKALSYAKYEIKNEENQSGGFIVIAFSIFVVVFANIVIWNR